MNTQAFLQIRIPMQWPVGSRSFTSGHQGTPLADDSNLQGEMYGTLKTELKGAQFLTPQLPQPKTAPAARPATHRRPA